MHVCDFLPGSKGIFVSELKGTQRMFTVLHCPTKFLTKFDPSPVPSTWLAIEDVKEPAHEVPEDAVAGGQDGPLAGGDTAGFERLEWF